MIHPARTDWRVLVRQQLALLADLLAEDDGRYMAEQRSIAERQHRREAA